MSDQTAVRTLVDRALLAVSGWGRFEERIRRYPVLKRCFGENRLRAQESPYHVHWLTWRMATWQGPHSEVLIANFAGLIEAATAEEGFADELRGNWGHGGHGAFWSLLWQLQVAAWLRTAGATVQWHSEGPDLCAVKSNRDVFVECYALQGFFDALAFMEELLEITHPDVQIARESLLPLSPTHRDLHLPDLMNGFLGPVTADATLAGARSRATVQWPVPISEGDGLRELLPHMWLEVKGPGESTAYRVRASGDPSWAFERLVTRAMSSKSNDDGTLKNDLARRRPNYLAINLLANLDAQYAESSTRKGFYAEEREAFFRYFAERKHPDLDAVGLSICEIGASRAGRPFAHFGATAVPWFDELIVPAQS